MARTKLPSTPSKEFLLDPELDIIGFTHSMAESLIGLDERPLECVGLFFYYLARHRWNNQVPSIAETGKDLNCGKDRILAIRKVLKGAGFIRDVKIKDPHTGQIVARKTQLMAVPKSGYPKSGTPGLINIKDINHIPPDPKGGSGGFLCSVCKSKVEGKVDTRQKDFEKFWTEYPRKIEKVAAKKAWVAIIKKKLLPPLPFLLGRLQAYQEGPWKDGDLKYIPYASTFINGERWMDQLPGEDSVPEWSSKDMGIIGKDESAIRKVLGTFVETFHSKAGSNGHEVMKDMERLEPFAKGLYDFAKRAGFSSSDVIKGSRRFARWAAEDIGTLTRIKPLTPPDGKIWKRYFEERGGKL